MTCKIYVIEEHDQVLDLWRVQQARSLRVLHMDAHCDMRGLLIDRQTQRAYRIWDMDRTADPGNFLTHAIFEDRISSLRWVFNELGGRQNDVGTVKYESDLTALPYRFILCLRGQRGIPIQFESMVAERWTGLDQDEFLDIDWDFFAPVGSSLKAIRSRVEDFLQTEFKYVPEQIYVCYSPQFSQPSRMEFQGFITDLAELFEAEVIHQPYHGDTAVTQPGYKKYVPAPFFRLLRYIYYKVNLSFRKWGIY